MLRFLGVTGLALLLAACEPPSPEGPSDTRDPDDVIPLPQLPFEEPILTANEDVAEICRATPGAELWTADVPGSDTFVDFNLAVAMNWIDRNRATCATDNSGMINLESGRVYWLLRGGIAIYECGRPDLGERWVCTQTTFYRDVPEGIDPALCEDRDGRCAITTRYVCEADLEGDLTPGREGCIEIP